MTVLSTIWITLLMLTEAQLIWVPEWVGLGLAITGHPDWMFCCQGQTVWKGDCGLKEGFLSFFSPSLPVPILPPSLFFPPYLPSSFLPSPLLSCSYVTVSVHLDSREELIIGGEGRIVEMESWGRREEMNTRAQAEGLIFDRIRVMSHTLGSDTLDWSILWERSYNCLYIFCH